MKDFKNIVFIHVPKTGGLSISNTLGIHRPGHFRASKLIKESCFSFAFVRNPFDRLVSTYHYLKKGGINKWDEHDSKRLIGDKSFEDFVYSLSTKKISSQQHLREQSFWLDSDKIDFIGRFENINSDFQKICKILNRKNKILRKDNQSNRGRYQDYYNKYTIEKTEELYKQDIERFNYKF